MATGSMNSKTDEDDVHVDGNKSIQPSTAKTRDTDDQCSLLGDQGDTCEIQEVGPANSVDPYHPGCSSRTDVGPDGFKQKVSSDHGTKKRKRMCKPQDSNQMGEFNADMIQQMDPSITLDEANAVLHDYNQARKFFDEQKFSNKDAIPSLELMIKLINDWKPKSDIFCMYVRWSKRLRRNYHLDSISTLLCVANQCDYTPQVFLKNIKSLTISCSNSTFGLNFKFDTCNNMAIDGRKLNEKFLGLSITLRLLVQRGIVSNTGTFGNIGLKTCRQQAIRNDDVYWTMDSTQKTACMVAKKPTSRFHTNAGLLGRIWLAIQHRWISIQVVEMLFPVQLAHAKSEQESLVYSFQMHSSAGPSRYDFLEPLIGVCLRFRSTSIIDNHATVLQTVWDEPCSFVSFGNGYLQGITEKDSVKYVVDTFQYLKSLMRHQKRMTIHQKTNREVKWQMIRGYAFHFWLDRMTNQKLKIAVDCQCVRSLETSTQDNFVSKKSNASSKRNAGTVDHQCARSLEKSHSITVTALSDRKASTEQTCTQAQRSSSSCVITCDDTNAKAVSGLSLLLCSREEGASEQSLTTAQPQLQEQSHHCFRAETTACSFNIQSIDESSFAWNTIRLATVSEITPRVSSYLSIHRDDGVEMVAELAPLEVYSADMLYKLRHSRVTGPPGSLTTSERGKVIFSIGAEVDKFIDQSSKIFHVAREDSNYFNEHGNKLPLVNHLSNLCKAVLKYGKSDMTRSPQQFRINIGCGGQHRPTGKPETLIGQSFKKALVSDPGIDAEEIIGTIGTMTEFTWNVLKDMQVDARDSPLAPDRVRQKEYSYHLANYLRVSDQVGFEDVTVVVGILYPMMANVAEHVDRMNDSVAGYTRTGVLNMVLTMKNEADVVLLHLQVICTFRRVIREYLFPFHSLLSNIANVICLSGRAAI